MSDSSNPDKPSRPNTASKLISRPQQPKLLRPYSPNRENFFDVMQEVMFDKLSVSAVENDTKSSHFATVYRVDENAGFFDFLLGANSIRVRARIDEPDTAHSTIVIPDSAEDQAKINLLVEFEGDIDEIGGKPKIGDIVEVEFYNKSNKTKLFGNGRIKKLISATAVAGVQNRNSSGILGALSNLFGANPDKCSQPGKKSPVKTTPPGGATLVGANAAATVSDRNPRKLNSPTEDSTDAISNSRLPEQKQSSNVPAGSSTPTPQENFANSRSSGPGPFRASPGSNQDTPNGGPKKNDPCDGQVQTVSAYRARKAEQRGRFFNTEALGGAAGIDKDGVPFTWDRGTDRRIKKMHPDARIIVADFINYAAERGYYLRVLETHRTVKRQNELYSHGRTVRPPNKTVTKARGKPKSSPHQYGIAFDCVEVAFGRDKRNKGKRFSTPGIGKSGFDDAYPKSRWYEIGAIGKQFGFVWGGNFTTFFDGPHFEVFRASIQQMRDKEKIGQVVVDPKLGRSFVFPKF